jgi:transposase
VKARVYEIPAKRSAPAARRVLRRLVERSRSGNDLRTWSRSTVVLGYIENRRLADLASQLGIDRSTATRWVAEYAKRGVPALHPTPPPGPTPKLDSVQLQRLSRIVEEGPMAAGFESAIWTARMVTALIATEFGVTYHWKYVPELLHRLGFSVQRPRKLLSRADRDAQRRWLDETLPAIKKKPAVRMG